MKEIILSKEPVRALPNFVEEIKEYLSKVVVLLHTVKEEELVAVYKYLKPPIDGFNNAAKYDVDGGMSLILGKFGNRDAAVLQTEIGECVKNIMKALNLLKNVLLVIGIGFAYGNKQKCKLGDVLISKFIYNVKSTRVLPDEVKLEGEISLIDMNRAIGVFVEGQLTHQFESVAADPITRKPKILDGTIMSGAHLLNNPQHVRDILKHDARSIGGEIEGSIIAECVLTFCKENRDHKIDFIIIKGVSDYGDEVEGKRWQFTASLAAVDYAESKLAKEMQFYHLPSKLQ